MLNMREFGKELTSLGYNFYTGVPCSFLKSLINYANRHKEYIASANEGDAVATAAGAVLGGKKAVVLMQNSGLTNAMSPLTSLNHPFQIPILGFVSLRGDPDLKDEPQHELLGKITTNLLSQMEIPWKFLPNDILEAKKALSYADQIIADQKSFFFVVKKGTFDVEEIFLSSKYTKEFFPTRLEILEKLSSLSVDKTLLIATTGYTGRELYEVEDKSNQFYMVGSLGCASSIGLGLAKAKPDQNVVVIDADGAFLMRMGAVATNAYYRTPNLLHLLLDNQVSASTGGQMTVSGNINFTKLAEAVGYSNVRSIHSVDELEKFYQKWQNKPKLTFLYIRIQKGSKPGLGRPKIKPHEVKTRFVKHIHRDEKSSYCCSRTL